MILRSQYKPLVEDYTGQHPSCSSSWKLCHVNNRKSGLREGRVYRKVVVGTVEQFPTKAAAKRAVETLRSTINAANAAVPLTVRQLAKHYQDNELPKKAWSTQKTVETTLRIWVLPNWGEHKLVNVRAVQVESWLHGLPLANHTKAKIRNVMHIIFSHGCRHEWLERTP